MYPNCEWLRDYELLALKALFHCFEDVDKKKLKLQFNQLDMIERSPNGKLLRFFDSLDAMRKKWSSDLLIKRNKSISGYQVVLREDNKIRIRFSAFFGYGGLGEIQFIKKPTIYTDKIIKTVTVKNNISDNLPENFEVELEKVLTNSDSEKLEKDIFDNS